MWIPRAQSVKRIKRFCKRVVLSKMWRQKAIDVRVYR